MDLKRLPVKYIRDRAKSAYEKGPKCEICGTSEKLDFHHYFSVDMLFTKWCRTKKLKIKNVDDILACRDEFIEDHHHEIYNETVTLCNQHHKLLHKVYGQKPLLTTGPKQKRWVAKQREKHCK